MSIPLTGAGRWFSDTGAQHKLLLQPQLLDAAGAAGPRGSAALAGGSAAGGRGRRRHRPHPGPHITRRPDLPTRLEPPVQPHHTQVSHTATRPGDPTWRPDWSHQYSRIIHRSVTRRPDLATRPGDPTCRPDWSRQYSRIIHRSVTLIRRPDLATRPGDPTRRPDLPTRLEPPVQPHHTQVSHTAPHHTRVSGHTAPTGHQLDRATNRPEGISIDPDGTQVGMKDFSQPESHSLLACGPDWPQQPPVARGTFLIVKKKPSIGQRKPSVVLKRRLRFSSRPRRETTTI